MKDFYKILGVKENASEEEIRARWVELTKRYHPDRGEDMASDEKIREINEAYQILKHSSTRVEYDLQRAYGQEKRGSYFKKLSIPASLLIIFIIVGLIYFNRFQTTSVSELTASNQINQTNLSRLPSNLSVQGEMGSLFHWDQRNEINQRNQIDQINPIDPTTQKPSVASKPQRIDSSTQQTQRLKDPVTPITQLSNDLITNRPSDAKDSMTQRPNDAKTPINPIIPTAQAAEIQNPSPSVAVVATTQKVQLPQQPKDSIDAIDPTTQRLKDPTNPMISTNITIQTNAADPKIELAQFKPPSLLATEDEVRKFFDSYTERYNRMDIESFLSLFSSKAIQNKKDGLEGIRKIYTNFFNQGKEVRYRAQDMKIETYQNAIEARARYEIEQILKIGGEKKVWRGQICWVLGKENGALKILSLDYQHQ
jgi:curved DNA-binding protein CbpA